MQHEKPDEWNLLMHVHRKETAIKGGSYNQEQPREMVSRRIEQQIKIIFISMPETP